MRWKKDELRRIAETDDLHISPLREDGKTYGTPTWMVRRGGRRALRAGVQRAASAARSRRCCVRRRSVTCPEAKCEMTNRNPLMTLHNGVKMPALVGDHPECGTRQHLIRKKQDDMDYSADIKSRMEASMVTIFMAILVTAGVIITGCAPTGAGRVRPDQLEQVAQFNGSMHHRQNERGLDYGHDERKDQRAEGLAHAMRHDFGVVDSCYHGSDQGSPA